MRTEEKRLLLAEARRLSGSMIGLRRAIHRDPELGRRERRTQQRVIGALREMGASCREAADTGVIAEISGASDGPIVAIRADMDALPIGEQTALEYASENEGIMHACGHDVHTAALVGAARLLMEHRSGFRGTVRLLFQPDEESDGGAERMIRDGAMEGVRAVFGMHVDPEIETGTVGVCPGPAYAASNPFDIVIRGAAAHGAEPQRGRDALAAACVIVEALQTMASRMISPLEPAVITVGSLRAGSARNIIAREAELNGIIRCFGETSRARITGQLEKLAVSLADSMRVSAEVRIVHGYDGVVNDEGLTGFVSDAAGELLGQERVCAYPAACTTEDFGAYLRHAPGSFWHMGVKAPGAACAPLHSPCFAPDESAIPIAAAVHASIAIEFLSAFGLRS